jgi:hypothetical protein
MMRAVIEGIAAEIIAVANPMMAGIREAINAIAVPMAAVPIEMSIGMILSIPVIAPPVDLPTA